MSLPPASVPADVSPESISVHWVQRVLRAAEAAGVQVGRLRTRIGLSERDTGIFVDREVLFDVWEELVETSGDRALPIHAATHVRNERTDVLVFACATCATLEEAIRRLAEAIGLWTRSIIIRPLDQADGSLLLDIRRVRPSARLGAALADEFVLADAVGMMRWMTETTGSPAEVTFAHASPLDVRAHRAHFRCPVHFAAHANAVVLPPSVLAMRLVRHDPWIAQVADAALSKVAEETRSRAPGGFADQVRRHLLGAFMTSVPTMEQVAKRLGTGARSLRRRLREEHTTYRDVLEEARRDEATRLVGTTDRAMAEIAGALGFAHPSTFHRAFVRWTGVAPSQFRATARAQPHAG